jgi:hypothetical protein
MQKLKIDWLDYEGGAQFCHKSRFAVSLDGSNAWNLVAADRLRC